MYFYFEKIDQGMAIRARRRRGTHAFLRVTSLPLPPRGEACARGRGRA
jgi:hypothetical protein